MDSELLREHNEDSTKFRPAFNLAVDHLVAVLSGKKPMTDMARLSSVTCTTMKGLVQGEAHKDQNALIRFKMVSEMTKQLPLRTK